MSRNTCNESCPRTLKKIGTKIVLENSEEVSVSSGVLGPLLRNVAFDGVFGLDTTLLERAGDTLMLSVRSNSAIVADKLVTVALSAVADHTEEPGQLKNGNNIIH